MVLARLRGEFTSGAQHKRAGMAGLVARHLGIGKTLDDREEKGGGLAGVNADAQLASSRSSYKSAALLINYNSNGCVNTFEFTTTSF